MVTKITDLNKVKEVLKVLLRVTPQPYEELPIICYHPFTNSSYVGGRDKTMLNILDENDFNEWVSIMDEKIDAMSDVHSSTLWLNTAYLLTFLKFAKPHLSIEDFSKLLAYCWTAEEDPSQDKNVKLRTVVSWFKQAKPEYMMSDREKYYLNTLPDMVTVYRGVGVGRARRGLSWTANKDTAVWFAKRFNHKDRVGYVLTATVPKSRIFCYLNDRGEDELVIDVKEEELSVLKTK